MQRMRMQRLNKHKLTSETGKDDIRSTRHGVARTGRSEKSAKNPIMYIAEIQKIIPTRYPATYIADKMYPSVDTEEV